MMACLDKLRGEDSSADTSQKVVLELSLLFSILQVSYLLIALSLRRVNQNLLRGVIVIGM